MTTGSTTTSKITAPIHHRTMAFSLACGVVGDEEPAEDPGQGHPGGSQRDREAARRGGRRGGLLQRLAPVDPLDPVLEVGREVAHQHGGNVGDHAAAVLGGGASELEVLGDVDPGTSASAG